MAGFSSAIFNPRLPILADELKALSLSKDTRGDLDPEWRRDAEFHNSTVGDPLQTSPNERDEFVNQEVFDAYCCGMRVSSSGLWKVDKAAVESGAREALAISEICPPAYWALATIAPTYEEALQFFATGASSGKEVVGEEEWNKRVRGGELWEHISTRYSFLCYIGQANTLVTLGKYKEAKEIYEFLEGANIEFHSECSTYPNWRFNVIAVYLGLKDYQGLIRYLTAKDDFFSHQTCTNVKIYTKIFLSYVFGMNYANDTFRHQLLAMAYSQTAILTRWVGNLHSPTLYRTSKVAYRLAPTHYSAYKRFWDAGAISKLRNDYKRQFSNLLITLYKSQNREAPKPSDSSLPSAFASMEIGNKKRKTLTELWIPRLKKAKPLQLNFQEFDKSSEMIFHKASEMEDVPMLEFLWKYFNITEKNFNKVTIDIGHGVTLTPLHQACYYGYTKSVKFMMERGGAKTLLDSPNSSQSPLEMLLNQMNADIMQYLWERDHSIFRRVRFTDGGYHAGSCFILRSGVTFCLAYGDPCTRCELEGANTHAPQASVARALAIVIKEPKDVILACEGKQTIIQHVLSGLVRSPIIEEVLKLHKKNGWTMVREEQDAEALVQTMHSTDVESISLFYLRLLVTYFKPEIVRKSINMRFTYGNHGLTLLEMVKIRKNQIMTKAIEAFFADQAFDYNSHLNSSPDATKKRKAQLAAKHQHQHKPDGSCCDHDHDHDHGHSHKHPPKQIQQKHQHSPDGSCCEDHDHGHGHSHSHGHNHGQKQPHQHSHDGSCCGGPDKGPSQVEILKEEGNKHFRGQNYEKAVALYSNAITILVAEGKTNTEVYFTCLSNRSIALFKQTKYSQSLADCNAYLKHNPTSGKFWETRGNNMMGLHKIVPAVESFIRAHHLSPTQKVKKKLAEATNLQDPAKHVCCTCGAANEKSLMKCGQCKRTGYCSKACQVEDWKLGHKVLCLPLKNYSAPQ